MIWLKMIANFMDSQMLEKSPAPIDLNLVSQFPFYFLFRVFGLWDECQTARHRGGEIFSELFGIHPVP